MDVAAQPTPALLQFWSKFKVPPVVPVATPVRARATEAVEVGETASTLPDAESYHPDNQLGLEASPSISPAPSVLASAVGGAPAGVRSSGPMPVEASPGPSLPPTTPLRSSDVTGTPSGVVQVALQRATTVDLCSPHAPPGTVASQKLDDAEVDAAVHNSVLRLLCACHDEGNCILILHPVLGKASPCTQSQVSSLHAQCPVCSDAETVYLLCFGVLNLIAAEVQLAPKQ